MSCRALLHGLYSEIKKLKTQYKMFPIMGVGTGGAEGAAAPPTFGTGEQAIALAPPKV